MNFSEALKANLNKIIVEVSQSSEFVRSPKTDFTRNRKLDFCTTFNSILTMGGNSLDHELLELFDYGVSTPCKSAFVQARHKILPEAFSHTFFAFTQSLRRPKTYKGFHLLAVDGSAVNILRDPKDTETYIANHTHRGHNAFKMTAMYDLMNHLYTDVVLHGAKHQDERGALIDMIPNVSTPSIVVCDRGYESYNIFAHFEENKQTYLTRVKDHDSNGILSGLHLPNQTFDECFTVQVSNFQGQRYKALPNFRFSPSIARFDFSTKEHPVYHLTFRVVRIQLDNGHFQSFITNLPSTFTPMDIEHLYRLRWGIETSFRQLKYAVGLAHFHAKKKDSIFQEIYARLIVHNFCESIVQHTILHTQSTKHEYKINFARAVQICRKYLRFFNTILIQIEAHISKYLSIVRRNRSFKRHPYKKGFVSFVYRVS